MNKLSFIFLILVIAFSSCDGRDRKHKTNAEILKENKLLDTFSRTINYVPEDYIEIKTDTIFNNGFYVKIKYNVLNNDYISKTSANSNKTIHYKNFEAKLEVLKHEKLITQSVIKKKLFEKFETSEFWKNAIMQSVWVDFENSTDKKIVLNTSFQILNTDIYKDFSILIFENGDIDIKQINLIPNRI